MVNWLKVGYFNYKLHIVQNKDLKGQCTSGAHFVAPPVPRTGGANERAGGEFPHQLQW